MADIFGSIIGAGTNIALGYLNNSLAAGRTALDRQQNYMYGEMAANNADKRTRALYNDLYSPKAQMKQVQEAGLSPSIYFGGTPGQGGTSGAQGSGAAGIQTPYMPMSMLEGAQIANIMAQTQKTKAETKNIDKDTDLKNLQEQWDTWRNNEHSVEFDLTTIYLTVDGQETSLYELATKAYDYDEYLKQLRNIAQQEGRQDFIDKIGTELGQKTLRRIYMDSNVFERDINVLSEENVSSKFQISVLNALKKEGFADMNAKAAIQELKTSIAVNELSESQKNAWNDILNKLEKKSSTAKDIAIILGMIVTTFAGKANISVSKKI